VSKYTPFQAIDGCLIRLAMMDAFLRDTQVPMSDHQLKVPSPMIYVTTLILERK